MESQHKLIARQVKVTDGVPSLSYCIRSHSAFGRFRETISIPMAFDMFRGCGENYYSSSIGTTAHCRLWPVEQFASIFFLSATNSLNLLTASTWRSLSTSSFHLFLGLPLLLVPSSSWVTTFLVILSSSILSRWPNQLILCPFNHYTIFSLLFIFSISRFVRLFHSPFSYLGPYILLNIFLSKFIRTLLNYESLKSQVHQLTQAVKTE